MVTRQQLSVSQALGKSPGGGGGRGELGLMWEHGEGATLRQQSLLLEGEAGGDTRLRQGHRGSTVSWWPWGGS
jgi:hypothetical protein